jgi:hypothetical protein
VQISDTKNYQKYMNSITNIFIQEQDYELKVVIKKVTQKEISNAKEFSKESNYENPIHAMHSGMPVNKEKLFFRPDFNNYCPV